MTATAWRSTRPPPLASAGTAWIDVFAEHGYNDILTLDDGRLRDIETDIVRGTGLRRLDPDGGTTLVSSPDPRSEVFDGCPAIVVDAGDVSADGRGPSGLLNRWERHNPEGVGPGRAVGPLIQECVGHGMEADNIVDRDSVFGRSLGSTVALTDLTVVDDPTHPMSWCSHRYDDEGTAAVPTRLVDRGVLRGLLHTRATAVRFGERPCGNALRDTFAAPPLARMTTTYALPSGTDTAALLRSVPEALHCRHLDGGQGDPATGQLVFTAREVSCL